jgi:mono/diheme cytochrome c family protein
MRGSFSSRVRKRSCLRLFVLLLFIREIPLTQARGSTQDQKAGPKANNPESASGPTQESAASSKQAEGSPAGNAGKGEKLFMTNGCFECHGTVGQGATATGGVRIGPPAISFEEMVQYVHHPSGQMPPYTSKVISDHDLADIFAYLKAQPRPAKSIPLLNQ